MAGDNDCPRCERDIGIWAVFKATLPNRIYCPHCGARLEYGGTWGLIAFAVVASLLLLGFAVLVWLNVEDQVYAWGASGVIFLLGGTLLEVGLVMQLWYGDYRLRQVGRPRPTEDADPDW